MTADERHDAWTDDATNTREEIAAAVVAFERVGYAYHVTLSSAMFAMQSAMIDFCSAGATRILEQFPTCEPVTVSIGRTPRRLPGPVPERIVRRAMRGRGWQQ